MAMGAFAHVAEVTVVFDIADANKLALCNVDVMNPQAQCGKHSWSIELCCMNSIEGMKEVLTIQVGTKVAMGFHKLQVWNLSFHLILVYKIQDAWSQSSQMRDIK